MNLTPLDIRRHQFAKAFRGYDPTEVDAFLKQLAGRIESMQEEVRLANDRVRDADAKLTHYEKVELALQEALEAARETARRAEAGAEAKAQLIIEQAELKAQQLVQDAERERYGLRHDLAKLNSRQAEVAARLRGFLLSELEILAQFQGDDPVGFIKLQSAAPAGALPAPRAQLSAGDPGAGAPEPEMPPAEREAAATLTETPADAPSATPDTEAFASETGTPADFGVLGSAPDAAPAPTPEAEAPPEPDPEPDDAAAPEPAPGPSQWTTPPLEPVAPAPDAANASEAPDEPALPPAVTGGWDLRSLVTGEERSVAASEAERERIRRILDDLD